MTGKSDFTVTFWGVRGSVACPGPTHAKYGGNTSCVEVRAGDKLIIFDAGTGLRNMGESLRDAAPIDGDLFLTHTHLDHLAGLPFFAPFFDKRNSFRIWAGHLAPLHDLHTVLCQYMAAPLFPVPPQIFDAKIQFLDFKAGETQELGEEVRIRTAPLNHPNGATGYRVDYRGRSFCFVTDTEHRDDERDPNIVELIRGADVMAYDCSYTDEEFHRYLGWGHSTWQEGLRLIEAAGCDRLVLFHHDPLHDDEAMDAIAETATSARPGTIVARDGMVLEL